MSFWKLGPTELRILLAIGTMMLFVKPTSAIGGVGYRLFDVGGAVAVVALAVTAVLSMIRHTRMLYRAEPLPARQRDTA
jgi:hypothetical protein